MTRAKPLFEFDGETRSIAFLDDETFAVRFERKWSLIRLADLSVSELPLNSLTAAVVRSGTARWLLDGHGKAWAEGMTESSDTWIQFAASPLCGTVPLFAAPSDASAWAFAGGPGGQGIKIWLDPPHPLEDEMKMDLDLAKAVFEPFAGFQGDDGEDCSLAGAAPVRLLWSADAGVLAAVGAAGQVLLYDRRTKKRWHRKVSVEGHSAWAAMSPTQGFLAVFSRVLSFVAVPGGEDAPRSLFDCGSAATMGGEFTPDGKWLIFTTGLGVVALDTAHWRAHLIADAANGDCGLGPVRVSPSGRFLVLPTAKGFSVHETALILNTTR